ncbi:MAG: hypothetical protein EZS28_025527 [Streblomastix strix]|uniref:Uncharacterized protein n=1 Tax=Streblomastix strix TaxID=222440 RepID=A0A5J4V8V7_9EUKA|nr:MAG: hypothetical protein EZS28_025527 [Streblomastix strix]
MMEIEYQIMDGDYLDQLKDGDQLDQRDCGDKLDYGNQLGGQTGGSGGGYFQSFSNYCDYDFCIFTNACYRIVYQGGDLSEFNPVLVLNQRSIN